jgi:hypothetical protein
MAAIPRLSGINEVMRNLNAEIQRIENRTMKGLILSAEQIRRRMESKTPYIPFDYGNLQSSWFIVTSKSHIGARVAPAFKGPDAGVLMSFHSETLAEAKGMLSGVSQPVLIMGFTANYAAWVHEMIGKNINWSKEGSGPKFFQRAIEDKRDSILATIKREAQIK